MSYIGNRDAMIRGLDLILAHKLSGLWVFDIPGCVHNARSALKDGLDLLGDARLAIQVGAVNLGHQSLHHGRPRRNLAHLDTGSVLVANRVQQRTKPLGNRMARSEEHTSELQS